MRFNTLVLLAIVAPLFSIQPVLAQSTFGVVLGSVRDSSGAVVSGAVVRLLNVGMSTDRGTISSSNGDYEFLNTNPGEYSISMIQSGFQTYRVPRVRLSARQSLRIDAVLPVGELSQTVEVQGEAGVIATDTPSIASTLSTEKVLNLPANVRAGGSTSPYSLIATLPGVQADNGGAYSIQGGLPAQSESSVNGISITAVTGNSPNRSLFPSVESIAEIKVQGVGNGAEFGAPGDITTISKGGSNDYHGNGFWYHQNRALDARSFNQAVLPAKIGNTFGGSIGGPVLLPNFYNGRNKTFYFSHGSRSASPAKPPFKTRCQPRRCATEISTPKESRFAIRSPACHFPETSFPPAGSTMCRKPSFHSIRCPTPMPESG